MRDRLIELIVSADISLFGTDKPYAEVYADYLLANGVIVPPCKVGDTVYFVVEFDEDCKCYVDKGRVYAIIQNENTLWLSVRYLSGLRYDHTPNDFGKTVFLTKEEAEKALKERGDTE